MIRRSKDKESITKPAPFNGIGEITVRSLLNGPEEMDLLYPFRKRQIQ